MNLPLLSDVALKKSRNGHTVLRTFIDAGNWNVVIAKLMSWAVSSESRYGCLCNVHVVVTAHQECDFLNVVNNADMAMPDGMPIAWVLRRLGYKDQVRIDGPGLMQRICQCSAQINIPVFFYGSTEETLEKLSNRLKLLLPHINIAGTYSPPFRKLTPAEDRTIIDAINTSGAKIVFVGLGCPKQEKWMAAHRGEIDAVMLGVGAAFDFYAGTVKRAPRWMRKFGIEWLFRLFREPKRLWKRYTITNSLFLLLMLKEGFFKNPSHDLRQSRRLDL